MNLYQQLIKVLIERKNNGEDIGNAIHYCTHSAFDLLELHNTGTSFDDVVAICLNNK